MANPVALVMVITIVLIFEASYVNGTRDAAQGIEMPTDSTEDRNCAGWGNAIDCAWQSIRDAARVTKDGIVMVWQLFSFDVPGAPWQIRAVFGTFFTSMGVWITVTLVRGFKA